MLAKVTVVKIVH